MAKKTISTRFAPQSTVKNLQNNVSFSSSPLLTPLALMLLGMVEMARAQAVRSYEVLAVPSSTEAHAAAVAAAWDQVMDVDGSDPQSMQAAW